MTRERPTTFAASITVEPHANSAHQEFEADVEHLCADGVSITYRSGTTARVDRAGDSTPWISGCIEASWSASSVRPGAQDHISQRGGRVPAITGAG